MALWGKDDKANNAPKWSVGSGIGVSGNGYTLYANSITTPAKTGLFAVDPKRQRKLRNTNTNAAHSGWVLRTYGTGGRAGRVQTETLVAMNSVVPTHSYWITEIDDDAIGWLTVVDSEDNIYVLGSNDGITQTTILKLDMNGNIVWQKYIDNGDSSFEGPYGLTIDSNDNIYFAVYATMNPSSLLYTNVFKMNSNGEILWQKRVEMNIPDSWTSPYGGYIDQDNNYHLALYLWDGTLDYKLCFIKFDSEGNVVFKKEMDIHPASAISEAAYNIIPHANNIYIIGYESMNAVIVKADSTANNIIWQKKYTATELAGSGLTPYHSVLDAENNIIVGGYVNSSTISSIEGFLLKIDSATGNVIWNKTLGVNGRTEYSWNTSVDDDNNIYIALESESLSYDKSNAHIAKYDSAGNLLWQRQIKANTTPAGVNGDYIWAITPDNDQGIIVVGGVTPPDEIERGVIAKLPRDGSLTGTYSYYVYEQSNLTQNTIATLSTLTPSYIINNSSVYVNSVSVMVNTSSYSANTIRLN